MHGLVLPKDDAAKRLLECAESVPVRGGGLIVWNSRHASGNPFDVASIDHWSYNWRCDDVSRAAGRRKRLLVLKALLPERHVVTQNADILGDEVVPQAVSGAFDKTATVFARSPGMARCLERSEIDSATFDLWAPSMDLPYLLDLAADEIPNRPYLIPDPAYVRTSTRVVTQASELTGVAVQQALGAFRQSYEVTTVAEGLAMVDSNELNVVTFRHTATGTLLDVFEYGAGDTSVGAIYLQGTTTFAGVITDLSIEDCALFQ